MSLRANLKQILNYKILLTSPLLLLAACNSHVRDEHLSLRAQNHYSAPQVLSSYSYSSYGLPPAWNGNGKGLADELPSGSEVSPPTGFLELCSRTPYECKRLTGDESRIREAARDALVRRVTLALGLPDTTTVLKVNSTPTPATAALAVDTRSSDAGQSKNFEETATIASAYRTKRTFTVDNAPISRLSPYDGYPSGQSDLSHTGRNDPSNLSSTTAPQTPFSKYSTFYQQYSPFSMIINPQPGAILPATDRRLTWSGKADTPLLSPPAPSLGNQSTSPRTYGPNQYQVTPPPGGASENITRRAPSDTSSYRNVAGPAIGEEILPLLERVNSLVNSTLVSDTDERIYHVADYWSAPGLRRGLRADCEDFVLQKRDELIKYGVPAAAMSIAIVKTSRRGEIHAVLVVATTAGDYILDNMAPQVKHWRDVDYIWVSKQSPVDELGWVSLSRANMARGDGRPSRLVYGR